MAKKISDKISISFVLPTFNESKNIIPLIKNILKLNSIYDLQIIVIDDNSSDGTSSIVSKFSKRIGR